MEKEEKEEEKEEKEEEKEEKEEENFYSGGRSVSWPLCQNLDELIDHCCLLPEPFKYFM